MAGDNKSRAKSSSSSTLTKRVVELESENKKLRNQLKSRHKFKEFFRKLAVVILVILTAFFLNLGVSAVWLKRNIVNTDTWVAKTTDLIENPDIRQQISSGISNRIFSAVDVEQYIKQVLPEQIQGLSAPLTQSLEDRTTSRIDDALESQTFIQFWGNASASAHQGIIDSLENGGNASTDVQQNNLIYINDDKMVLNLKPVFNQIKTRLSEQGLTFVNNLSGERIAGTIDLIKIENLSSILTVFNMINKLAWFLPLAGLASAIGAVALTKSKRKVIIALGATTALFMVLNVQLVYLAKYPIVNAVASSLQASTTASAEAAFTIITADLVTMSRTLFAISILVVLGGLITGPSKPAVALRNGTGKLLGAGKSDSQAVKWIADNANYIVGAICVLAVILLLAPLGSGPAYVLSITVSAILLGFITLSIKQTVKK